MKKYILIIALLCAGCDSNGQTGVNNLITQDDVTRIIKTLSADDMQGRAPFTPGIEKAAQFIESEYQHIGLKPMASNTGYRQNFTLMQSSLLKLQANINGIDISADHLIAVGGASFNWDNNTDVRVIKETADKNFRNDYKEYLSGSKKLLVLVDTSFKKLFNTIGTRLAQSSASANPDKEQQVVFVLGKTDSVKSFKVNYQIKVQESPLFNIAGVIPGKTKPNEYVIFAGHYDHLGIGKGMQGDSIYNGADDDASGTTAVISLANYYKKLNNNARTLVFVAFTAEELGGLGSQHFATTIKPDKVVAMFNIEMIGKPSKFGRHSAFITGYNKSTFGSILKKNLKGTGFNFYPDPYPALNLFYRSDNASLAQVGVPAHTISTDPIDADKDYHQVTDELKTLDVANITTTIRAIALSSRSIVSGKDTPTRVTKLDK